jgi:F-type H+-transporting ATPase subunit beta
MPIGDAVYGRLFNVIGDAIDGLGNLLRPVMMVFYAQICTSVWGPFYIYQFFTGIKIDLIEPYAKRLEKCGLFSGAGVGKTVLYKS